MGRGPVSFVPGFLSEWIPESGSLKMLLGLRRLVVLPKWTNIVLLLNLMLV
jgi:hypothetical protein